MLGRTQAAGDALLGGSSMQCQPRGWRYWSSRDPVVPPDQVQGDLFRLAGFDFGAVIPASK
jgi:hypothetical protein